MSNKQSPHLASTIGALNQCELAVTQSRIDNFNLLILFGQVQRKEIRIIIYNKK